VDDPKVQRLSPILFKAWVNFLCIAKKHDGKLPDSSEIAYRLRITKLKAEYLLGELVKANLFEWKDGIAYPHNWEGRQFKSDDITERVKRHRGGKGNVSRNVTRNVSVTVDETLDETLDETDQNRTDTEQKPPKPLSGPKYSPEFLEFWANSTKRGSKSEAFKEWSKLKPDEAMRAEIHAGMQAWKASEQWQDEKLQPHICRWLKRRGWEELVPRAKARTATVHDFL